MPGGSFVAVEPFGGNSNISAIMCLKYFTFLSLSHRLFSIKVVGACSHFVSSSHIDWYSYTSYHKDLFHIGGEILQ